MEKLSYDKDVKNFLTFRSDAITSGVSSYEELPTSDKLLYCHLKFKVNLVQAMMFYESYANNGLIIELCDTINKIVMFLKERHCK